MDTFLFLLVIGAVAFYFFRGSTNRGAEFVRAHIYLGGLDAGATSQEANTVASVDLINIPTEILSILVSEAKMRSASRYQGKQLPMIADAYRLGMTQRLPNWQKTVMRFNSKF